MQIIWWITIWIVQKNIVVDGIWMGYMIADKDDVNGTGEIQNRNSIWKFKSVWVWWQATVISNVNCNSLQIVPNRWVVERLLESSNPICSRWAIPKSDQRFLTWREHSTKVTYFEFRILYILVDSSKFVSRFLCSLRPSKTIQHFRLRKHLMRSKLLKHQWYLLRKKSMTLVREATLRLA